VKPLAAVTDSSSQRTSAIAQALLLQRPPQSLYRHQRLTRFATRYSPSLTRQIIATFQRLNAQLAQIVYLPTLTVQLLAAAGGLVSLRVAATAPAQQPQRQLQPLRLDAPRFSPSITSRIIVTFQRINGRLAQQSATKLLVQLLAAATGRFLGLVMYASVQSQPQRQQ